jgi:hypothetical protein
MRFPDNRRLKTSVSFAKKNDLGSGSLNAMNREYDMNMKRNDFLLTRGAGIEDNGEDALSLTSLDFAAGSRQRKSSDNH